MTETHVQEPTMTHNDVVTHEGETYRLADLMQATPDEVREDVHSDFTGAKDDYQGFWDLLAERHPASANLAALETEPVQTIWDRMQADDNVHWTIEGGVVRVVDGQITWYAEEGDWEDAIRWAERNCTKNDYEHQWYDAFCGECPGIADGGKDSLPLVARYAAAKFDMASEDGREQALAELFGGDEDDLADACILIDMASDETAARGADHA